MQKTIQVTGHARLRIKPDYMYIHMTIEAYDKEYDLALKRGKKQLAMVNDVLMMQGFAADALKTLDFQVLTDYVRNADARGRFKNEFNCYICRYRVKLGMDLDMKKAENVLSSLQTLVCHPRTSIDFTLKQPEQADKVLLEKTVQDAFEKSDIITNAAHIKKGDLLSMDYGSSKHNYVSDTHYTPTENFKSPSRKNFHPNEIELEDYITIVWAIES
jgi:hypothetical protein